jgi:hypothetical protein
MVRWAEMRFGEFRARVNHGFETEKYETMVLKYVFVAWWN